MPIYKGINTLKAFKGERQPVNIYLGNQKLAGWEDVEYSGKQIAVDNTYNYNIPYLKIEGDTRQIGIPSPSSPSPINSTSNFDLIITNGGSKNQTLHIPYDLNKLPNGVFDYIEIDAKTKTAKKVQKVGISNGVENWLVNSMSSDPDNMYLPAITAPNVANNIRCSHLPIAQSGSASSIYTNAVGNIAVRLERSLTGILTTDGTATKISKFKTCLANMGLSIHYQLPTPIETLLDYNTIIAQLKQFDPHTEVYTNATIQPNLIAQIRIIGG